MTFHIWNSEFILSPARCCQAIAHGERCEAYFLIGESNIPRGDRDEAAKALKVVAQTCSKNWSAQATAELKRLNPWALRGVAPSVPVQQINAGLDSLAVALQRVRPFQKRNVSRADEPPSLPAVTARDSSTPNCGPALAVQPTFGRLPDLCSRSKVRAQNAYSITRSARASKGYTICPICPECRGSSSLCLLLRLKLAELSCVEQNFVGADFTVLDSEK